VDLSSNGPVLRSAAQERPVEASGVDQVPTEGFSGAPLGNRGVFAANYGEESSARFYLRMVPNIQNTNRVRLTKQQGGPPERLLRRVVEFDVETLSGGRPVVDDDSDREYFGEDGELVTAYEIVGPSPGPGVSESFDIPIEFR